MQLKQKREGLIREIRNKDRQQIIKRARSQAIIQINQEQLNHLIRSTTQKITKSQLSLLIRFANLQFHKAVAHLGNLVLDRVVSISMLDQFRLQPGYHPYWLWLIEVLTEKQYCTLQLLQHTIRTISPIRGQKAVNSALSILCKITESNMHSTLLLRDQKAILAIFNASLRGDSCCVKAYLLLNELVAKTKQGIKYSLGQGELRNKFILSIKNGILKSDGPTKKLAYRLLTEAARQDLFLQEINMPVMRSMQADNDNLQKGQLLDYLMQYSMKMAPEQLVKRINDGLIMVLGRWRSGLNDQDSGLLQKIIVLGRQINERTSQIGLLSKGITHELQRYGLLSLNLNMVIE